MLIGCSCVNVFVITRFFLSLGFTHHYYLSLKLVVKLSEWSSLMCVCGEHYMHEPQIINRQMCQSF